MRRRQALQIAAAAATLPLLGTACGANSSKPATTEASATPKASVEKTAEKTAALPSASPTPEPSAPTAQATPEPVKEEPKPEPPKPSYARVIAKLGKNHGHVFVVTLADVLAGVEKTYSITGTSKHPHEVTLTAENMKTLLRGELLRATSTQGLTHKHRVSVRCAPAEDPPEWVTACVAEFSGQDEHELIIPAADMAAEVEKSYDVQGLAGHAHTVSLKTADFQKLKKEGAISVRTSRLEEDAHNHVVIIKYRAPKRG